MTEDKGQDPFAHLKQRASERADRTVERIRAGIAALLATDQKITAESLKQVTRELEPGFAGLSFQVIRRNQLAYALYREVAAAFTPPAPLNRRGPTQRRPRHTNDRRSRSSYDPLQRLSKRDLVRRIRALEGQLEAELQKRGALAYDQQVLRARLVRLETELVLRQAERSDDDRGQKTWG